jgi:hypothetical protein
VLSLGAKPRGLKPGNNILILFQKICAFMFYPKFLLEGQVIFQMMGGCMLKERMQFHG